MSRPESQRGMSLIEVMVALLVSAIGLFGALALIGTLLKGGDFSRRMTEASVLAQFRLEELVSLPYAKITSTYSAAAPVPTTFYFPNVDTNNCLTPPTMPTTGSTEDVDSLGVTWTAGTSTGTKFTRAWDGCTPSAGRKRIYVYVKWIDAVGPHTVTLSRDRSQ